MKTETKRYLTEITFTTEHYLANLMAVNKILGIPIATGRSLCKAKPEKPITFNPYYLVASPSSTDKLKEELSEYGITITIINQ